MRIKDWKYLIEDLNKLNLENDNVDVAVTLETGECFTVVVATIKNLEQQMVIDEKKYLSPGCPQIIVSSLEDGTVFQALSDFASGDAHWLKLYHCADIISTHELEKIYTCSQ